MKRLSAFAALLVPALVLGPMPAIAQETKLESQPDASLETGSIVSEPQQIEQDSLEEPFLQETPAVVEPPNLGLDGQFISWLSDLNSVAGASASANSVQLRSISDQLTISNLMINHPAYDLIVNIGSATLSKVSEPFGTYIVGADKVVLNDIHVRLGETEFETKNMVLTSALLPRLSLSSSKAETAKETRFERKLALITEMVRLVAGSISAPVLTVRIYSDKDDTEILAESHYRDNQISGLKGSKIGSLTLSGADTLSPPLEPIIEESFGTVELRNFNFNTVMKLFDGQKSPQVDGTLFDAFSLEDYSLSIGGLDLHFDTLQMVDVSVADIAGPTEDKLIQIIESTKDLDAINSEELPAFALELISLPTFGAVSIKGFEVDALGIRDFGFNTLSFNDLSISGMAVAQFSGFRAVLDEIGAVSLKGAGLSGLKLPSKETLISVANGDEVKPSDLLPTLDSLSVSGLSVQMPELGLEGGLEDLSLATNLDASGEISGIGVSIADLKLPGSLVPRDGTMIGRLGGIMDSIGIDTLQLNQMLSLDFDANSRKLSVSEFTADIAKLGGLSLTATIDNVSSSPFANPSSALREIRKGTLADAQIVFTNAGVVEAGFDAQAQKLGTKGETLRSQVGATLPFLVAVLQNPPFQQQLVKALQAFLPTPEKLTIQLKPESGVPISDIERQLRGDPRKLIGLLGTTIENTATLVPEVTPTKAETETPAD
ncbi:MAG: hypothetical protein AB8B94_03585 [Hyphomicrobiales bacterium]